jgi:hypothetical protein
MGEVFMGVRVGLVGARADVALMVAGVAAGCGAEVVTGLGLERPGREDPDGPPCGNAPIGECDVVLVDAVGHAPPPAASARRSGERSAAVSDAPASVVLVHLPGEAHVAMARGSALGADHVVELPTAGAWLGHLLGGLAEPSSVVAVLGAVGGAGATTVAMACASAAGDAATGITVPAPAGVPGCLLVDVDPGSTGLDLPLGIVGGEGARWSSIPDGAGALVSESLRVSLPRVDDVLVLTGRIPSPADPRVAAVVRAGRADFAATVLDVGRGPGGPSGLCERDAVVLVVPATLSGVVGAHRIIDQLPTRRVALAVRPTGWLPTAEVAAQVGLDRVVTVPAVRGLAERTDCGDVLHGRTGRALRRIGVDVWRALW